MLGTAQPQCLASDAGQAGGHGTQNYGPLFLLLSCHIASLPGPQISTRKWRVSFKSCVQLWRGVRVTVKTMGSESWVKFSALLYTRYVVLVMLLTSLGLSFLIHKMESHYYLLGKVVVKHK